MYDVLFDRLKEKKIPFSGGLLPAGPPEYDRTSCCWPVSICDFVISSCIFFANNSLFFLYIYLRFPFDKKVFLYFGYISICISLCISISLISFSLFPWPVFLLLFENFLCNHFLILRQHFFFLDLSLRQKFLLMHTILHDFQT